MAWNGRGRIQLFNVLRQRQDKKNLNLLPSIPRPHICGDVEGNNFNPGIRGP